jgi:hypothetical protein
MAPVVMGALKCAHQSLHSSGGAVKALTRSDNLDLDDATLTTANTVDGVDAEPAADKQPGHQKLSHRIPLSEHACQGCAPLLFFGSDNLLPAQKRVLRPSGGSERMLSAVIFKPHQSVVYVQRRTLIRPLTEPLQRLASARSGCRHRPVGPLGPLQVSLRTLREHLADELVASTSVRPHSTL